MVRLALCGLCALFGWLSICEKPLAPRHPKDNTGDRLFIYQGDYQNLGSLEEIAFLAALHDYAVFTHGFFLDGSSWKNGGCLDVNYSQMPRLLARVRALHPDIKLFVYVPATADHPFGCWPQPSIQMPRCPDGKCADFKTWVQLWLDLEKKNDDITIDGIFIDLVHPALIGRAVRDSVFSHVKSCGKLIMANALSDTAGLKFASSSAFLRSEDFLFIEGYHLLAGSPNLQTSGMNQLLRKLTIRWAALASETYNMDVDCFSKNRQDAYTLFVKNGGSAFAYQSADLGTQTGRWQYCLQTPK